MCSGTGNGAYLYRYAPSTCFPAIHPISGWPFPFKQMALYKDPGAFAPGSGDPPGIRTPDPLLKRQLLCRLSYRIRVKHLLPINHRPRGRIHGQWQGRLDSNQRMRESKSLALPLGDTPVWKGKRDRDTPDPSLFCGVGKGTRTLDTRNHNPVL